MSRIRLVSNSLDFVLDAATDVSHQWDSEVTKFPVESGVEISEHIIHKSKQLSISGWITSAGLKNQLISGHNKLKPATFEGLLYNKILVRELWAVYTKYRTYSNYALETFSIKNKGTDLEVSMQFTEVRFIKSNREVGFAGFADSDVDAAQEKTSVDVTVAQLNQTSQTVESQSLPRWKRQAEADNRTPALFSE